MSAAAEASAPAAAVAEAETVSVVAAPPPEDSAPDLRRRLTYLMLFRVALITLVLGATTLLYWLGDADLGGPSSLVLYGIIGTTYLLTIIYVVALRRLRGLTGLAHTQLAVDLVIASLLVHMTGGAQSAYTFFFPLTIIGAATVCSRNATIWISMMAALLFILVGLFTWMGLLPMPAGLVARVSPIDLSRSLGLNLAAIVGVSMLALNLATQLQRTSASLASERTAAADLLTLHSDIVRCLSSGLLTVDPWDMVLTVNQSACEILSTTPGAAVGGPIESLLPGLAGLLVGLGPKGAIQRGELAIARAGQPDLVVGISISPLADHGGRFLGRVVNFQDLTDLRKMEVSVKQAERLAMVGRLSAAVAHEIRNPLASISGSIELLRQMPQSDDDSHALMVIVTREIDRLNALLSDLLDYANPRPLKVAPLDLSELVRDTVRVFGQDRGLAGVTVDARTGEHSVPLDGDAAKLRQVLWNLMRNAAEAAAEGGGHVVVELRPGSEEVAIRVRDDGPGIPRELRDRVFEPFFTTKSQGTGLGLATVLNLVTDHRGTVQLESQPGHGTCLTVRLPYTGERGRPASPSEELER
ncbi:MAG TPA: ATP-binding protein [Kofleriaceae bacterium]|nr:ATP-binding protein [Kofleriaceae bacterium]